MNNDPPSLNQVNEMGNKESTWSGLISPKGLESGR